ncbi:MAG TPA: tetratricopeptide repeat protein [Terriglobales bacterium]|nr:tetratricopeptide repeat protein [Terriglobales bacterium]
MNKIAALFLLLFTGFVAAQTGPDKMPSPADRSIAVAKKMIAAKPAQYSGYNQLAIALARRARETSDPSFYAAAEDALQNSFRLSPGNVEGEKIQVWLLLGRHEFPAALESAKLLNKKVPDDVLVYGFLVDANAELGNYADSEKAAQRMLDLHPGNLPGLTRAAYLRELFGDVDGAFELMDMAYQATPPTETEDRAWILTQMAHLRSTTGNLQEAETLLQQALNLYPQYHYALSNLATLREKQAKYSAAVTLLEQLYASAPHAENLYRLAEALEKAGRLRESKAAFTEFESKSLREAVKKDNSSRELVFYYADHAHDPAKALTIAQQEYAWRHDVYTLDAFAWALHVNGRDQEARKEIEAAVSVGIRDAKLFSHAAEISASLGDERAARLYSTKAHELSAASSAPQFQKTPRT